MRSKLGLLTLIVLMPLTASAQQSFRVGIGALAGTKLLGDRVNPFDDIAGLNVVQSIAPTLQLSWTTTFSKDYRFRLTGEFGQTTLTVKDGDTGEQYEFGKLRTLSFLGMLEGKVVKNLEWQIGIGPLIYLPADRQGFFQDGGPVRWNVAAGLTKRVPVNAHMAITISGEYNYHQFTTKTLTDHGFSQYQTVQRAGIFVGVEKRY